MPARTPQPPQQPSPPPRAAGFRALLLVLSTILLLGAFSREIYDSDFWWHLRSGQYILEQHALPSPDPFSWTTTGARDAYASESRTRRFNLTHLLHHVGGSCSFPAGCNFENGLVTRFLST